MMANIANIEQAFKAKVSEKLRLETEGVERYRVFTPFLFEDGDHLAVLLKHESGRWYLSDEGHTYLHLTYDIDDKDLQRGTRQKVITNALSTFCVEDHNGELVLAVRDEQFGDALYSYVQALMRIADVSYLTRERVRSTFMEDFRSLMTATVPENRLVFDWHEPSNDPQGVYSVDCRVNGMPRPFFVFAVPSDDRARDATIALLTYEKWGVPHRSVAIFEDQEEVNRKVLARFSDVCEKQFSSLSGNKDRISKYIQEGMQ